MPIYILKCPKCKEIVELSCPVAERNSQTCEHCDENLIIQIQPVSSQWKTSCPTASEGRMCK